MSRSRLIVVVVLGMIWGWIVCEVWKAGLIDPALYWILLLVGSSVIGWNGEAIRVALWNLVGRE